ncbi:GNAT family N-acetyltransferase [Buchananella felis]|uniref:GNAT family N-acetyltransferase n=1 Tax=Buchananella felis TaxID=3231492 RepID=UPI0035299400
MRKAPFFPLSAGVQAYGLTWRLLGEPDAVAVSRVVSACEEADDPAYRTSMAETELLFHVDKHWVALGGFDEGGVLRAFGHVALRGSAPVEALCTGGVEPAWRERGIGLANLRWQVGAARELLERFAPRDSHRIAVHVDDNHVPLAQHLLELGYAENKRFQEWRFELTHSIPTMGLGHYLSVHPWSAELDDMVRLAYNELVASMPGSSAVNREEWEELKADFEPSWSFIALDKSTDRAKVAGFLFASRYEQDWQALGWREGYIDFFAVLAPWRGSGAGIAMISAALNRFKADGMEKAALELGADSVQMAGALADMGFEITTSSTLYVMDL